MFKKNAKLSNIWHLLKIVLNGNIMQFVFTPQEGSKAPSMLITLPDTLPDNLHTHLHQMKDRKWPHISVT